MLLLNLNNWKKSTYENQGEVTKSKKNTDTIELLNIVSCE